MPRTSLLIALLFLGAGGVALAQLPSAAELAAIRDLAVRRLHTRQLERGRRLALV